MALSETWDCFAGEDAVRVVVRRRHRDVALCQPARHRRHHVESSAALGHQRLLRVAGRQRPARRRR